MKKILLFAAITICCTPLCAHSPAAGEAGIRERIYVATDKENYLAGEIVWMKLITTDAQGAPLSFSKVGYVEITDESESRARARIEIRNGVGEGTVVLPSTLPTGWYRLTGYTRWMHNEGPEIFFEKLIGVVNPTLAEAPRGSGPAPSPQEPSVAASTGNIMVSADRGVYSPRSEVSLEISGIPADIHTLGISVTTADLAGGFASPSLGAWKESLSAGSQRVALPLSSSHEAEYEGVVVTGKLVSSNTGETVYSPDIIPYASFPGDDMNFFGGRIDESGRVIFRTSRATGFDDIATSMSGSRGRPYRIDLDDPFSQEKLARPLPTFPLEGIDREAMLRQSLAMQLQYSYVNDSLNRERRPAPLFFERPDHSYVMEEWRRFATMQEVATEFIQFVRFYRIDGERYLSVINRDFNFGRTYALVLLDGIPIIDHDIIYNYNPLLIKRIDVYYDRYIFGDNLFFGIVAFYTARNNYPELQPDPFTQVLSYPSPQARRLFYMPDHGDASVRASRVPDYRHTLYWNADIAAEEDGSARVGFFTSDLVGRYQVIVEGITASGEPVSAVCPIEVR